MRWLLAASALALAASSAYAQNAPGQMNINAAQQIGSHASKTRGEDNASKPRANDKAYDAALHNIPDKQYDPWHGVR